MSVTIDYKRIICNFWGNSFERDGVLGLWKPCPSQMLWEAIKKEDATLMSQEAVVQYLCQSSMAIVFPEPLPSLYLGIEPPYKVMPCKEIVKNAGLWCKNALKRGNSILEIEPLYIVSCDYSWMIVVTTENTSTGNTLCVLVRSKT